MSEDNVRRVAMWSGPRNISTAMMRSFENRSDTIVVDEPLYAYFLRETGIDHPGRDVIMQEQSSDWQQVAEDLLAPMPEGIKVFYQKHMTHHILPQMDRTWLDSLTHAFLIRDPRRMLASYVKTREEVTLFDIGISQQLEIFKRTCDHLGHAPPVIESADVLRNPAKMLEKLCDALKIDFDLAMLTWPEGKRDSDGVWAPWWYASVEKSTGFHPYVESAVDLPPHLQAIADQAMEAYEEMSGYRL